jgi:hypothetical protein
LKIEIIFPFQICSSIFQEDENEQIIIDTIHDEKIFPLQITKIMESYLFEIILNLKNKFISEIICEMNSWL